MCDVESAILSPTDRNVLPPPSQLERTALSLERKGNTRLLICVVEEWAQQDEPTEPARLAQIRGLMELCSVDRAWARLKPLLDRADSAEVFQLAGRILIDRGLTSEARSTLTRARRAFPEDAALDELLTETEAPGTVIDRAEPAEDDLDGQCRLAEQLLVEGSPLKARRILERVMRTDPEHDRTDDLLWALDGDFALKGVTLADLARVHATPVHSLLDATEMSDATESGANLPEADAKAAFPNLFKRDFEETDATETDQGDHEVTQASAIVTDAASNEVTQEHTREDTQIMHVVRTAKPDDDGADTLIDKPADLTTEGPRLSGESEDENVIVHVKRQIRERSESRRDDGRIHLDPARERVQRGANTVDEAAEFVRPRKRRQVTVEPAPPGASKRPEPPEKLAVDEPDASPPPTVRAKRPSEEDTLKTAQLDLPPSPPESAPLEPLPERETEPSGLAARAKPPGQRSAVSLQRIPTDERPRLDPALAGAPTEILDDEEPLQRRQGIAPWTAWLAVGVLFAVLVLGLGMLLIAFQVFSNL